MSIITITRSKLDSSELINSVQKCYDFSHSTLISKTIKLSIRHCLLKLVNLIVCLMILTFSIILGNFFEKHTLFIYTFVSLLSCFLILVLIISYRCYTGWREFIDRVIKKSDLSHIWANQVYSKEKNAMFIANLNNEPVIATAALLIGEEKNSKIIREEIVGELSENQALLTRVSVLPKHFGNGYGRAIVNACIEFAKSKNVKNIKLCTSSSQTEAIRLYKSLGFNITVVKELVSIFGFKLIVMELNL